MSMRLTSIGYREQRFYSKHGACTMLSPNDKNKAFAAVFTYDPTVIKTLEELLEYVLHIREATLELAVTFNQGYELP